MPTHVVSIPDWHPANLNRLLRLNGFARQRLLDSDAEIVWGHCRKAEVPEATGRRRVTVTLVLAGRDRKRDDDNTPKSLMDALKKAKMLIDDSTDWVERGPVRYERGARRGTTIELEDL